MIRIDLSWHGPACTDLDRLKCFGRTCHDAYRPAVTLLDQDWHRTDLSVGPPLVLEHDSRLVGMLGHCLLKQLRYRHVVPFAHLDPVDQPPKPLQRPEQQNKHRPMAFIAKRSPEVEEIGAVRNDRFPTSSGRQEEQFAAEARYNIPATNCTLQ